MASAQTMVQEHRQQLMQLRALADKDLRALLALIGDGDVARVRNALIEALPDVVAPYLTASGELAAVMFEDLRAEAGRRGTFYAETVPATLPASKVDATARWAVAPLADESLGSSVLTRLSGSVGRSIMDASRDTMALNGTREDVRFQRMPRPGCCAFCGMLASRPLYMAYRSEASASAVVGRGSTRTGFDENGKRLSGAAGKGVHARGKREIGAATHDDCHCVVVPLLGAEMTKLARLEREKYQEMYSQSLRGEHNERLDTTKQILSERRKYHGTR